MISENTVTFIHIPKEEFNNFLWLFFSFLSVYIFSHIPFFTTKLKNKFKNKKFSFIFGLISSTILLTLLLSSLYYLNEQPKTREEIDEDPIFFTSEEMKQEFLAAKKESINPDNIKFEEGILSNIMTGLYISSIILAIILSFLYSKTKSSLSLGFTLPLLVFVAAPFIVIFWEFFGSIFEAIFRQNYISIFSIITILILLIFFYCAFKYINKIYCKIFNHEFSIYKLILFITSIFIILLTPLISFMIISDIAQIFILFTIEPKETFYYHKWVYTTSFLSIFALFGVYKLFDNLYIKLDIKSKFNSIIWGFFSWFYSIGLISYFISLSLKFNYIYNIRDYARKAEDNHRYQMPNFVYDISFNQVNLIALIILSLLIFYIIYTLSSFVQNRKPVLIGKLIFITIFTFIFMYIIF